MLKYPNISEETAALQRREAMETRPQDQYTGRGKFQPCRQCGSRDGMRAVHRDTLAETPPPTLNWIKQQKLWWYEEPDNSAYLFYPCPHCNLDRTVPTNFVPLHDIPAWLNRDPMAPDYAALAAEEPVLASEMDRDSAGI